MTFLFLAIEEDERIASQRRQAFARSGIRTYVVPSFPQAMKALESWTFDAIVTSASTLGPSCPAVLRCLRLCCTAPVLLLVDRLDESRQISALESGATDVLETDASSELIVTKLLRLLEVRAEPPRAAVRRRLNTGSLELDEGAGLASVDGVALALTPYQFQLLALLATRAGAVVSREEVIQLLATVSDIRVVDVQVSRIRKKLKALDADDVVLRTVRGRGYSLATVVQRRMASQACAS